MHPRMFVISGPPDVPTGPSAKAVIGAAQLIARTITAIHFRDIASRREGLGDTDLRIHLLEKIASPSRRLRNTFNGRWWFSGRWWWQRTGSSGRFWNEHTGRSSLVCDRWLTIRHWLTLSAWPVPLTLPLSALQALRLGAHSFRCTC